jgi:cation:H+ antiporter
MFESFGLVGNAVVLAAALVALSRAADLTINNSINVASATGLGKTTVGFILVAFSTSLPELFVAFFSLVQPENVGISVGNVLGANLLNVCFILGLCFLLISLRYRRGVDFIGRIARDELSSLNFGLFVATLAPLLLLYARQASRLVGVLLFMVFAYNMYRLSKTGKPIEVASEAEKHARTKYLGLAFAGGVAVVACAFFIVESASNIASVLGVPPILIGATIVSFGTTMPELSTSIDSIRKGHPDLALGNVVGSCFVNVTCILGVTLMVAPFAVDMAAFSDLILFSLIANLVLWYFIQSARVSWREAAVLLFVYALFLFMSFS